MAKRVSANEVYGLYQLCAVCLDCNLALPLEGNNKVSYGHFCITKNWRTVQLSAPRSNGSGKRAITEGWVCPHCYEHRLRPEPSKPILAPWLRVRNARP